MENNINSNNKTRMEWEKKTYKKYMVRFRNDTERDLIDYVKEQSELHGISTSELFKMALVEYIENNQFK